MIKRWTFIIVAFFVLVAFYGEAAEQNVVMEIEGMTCSL